MINREDMMELTRRMTLSRNSFTRIAGCYVDRDGDYDGSFNVHFLKLSSSEKNKNLALAKTIPFASTNENLVQYKIPEKKQGIWQMLLAMRECGLKNDALMELFYERIMESYKSERAYGIFVFHDRYDVPVKAKDKERLGESEEVYEYMIGMICPLQGEYDPEPPEWGFLFPAFTDRSQDLNHIAVYEKQPDHPHSELIKSWL